MQGGVVAFFEKPQERVRGVWDDTVGIVKPLPEKYDGWGRGWEAVEICFLDTVGSFRVMLRFREFSQVFRRVSDSRQSGCHPPGLPHIAFSPEIQPFSSLKLGGGIKEIPKSRGRRVVRGRGAFIHGHVSGKMCLWLKFPG